MAELTEIEKKVQAGEKLTPEEEKEVMGSPAKITEGKETGDPDIDNAIEIETESQKKEREAQEAKDKAAKEADKKTPEPGDKKADTPETEKTSKDEKKTEGDEATKKVEEQLSKPEGQEDLSTFTPSEKGLYWSLRRERRARQLLEEENAFLQQEKLKGALKEKQTGKPADEKEKDAAEDILKLEDDEFVTVKDVKKLLTAKQSAEASLNPEADFFRSTFLRASEEVARTKHEDYDEVLECSPEIVQNGKHAALYASKIREAIVKGNNPALVMYDIIKGDPEFDKVIDVARARLKAQGFKLPEKKTEQVDKGKETEKKVDENLSKIKTSGHHSSGVEKTDPQDLTLEQIAAMPQSEYRKLPKAKRDYYMKKYG